MITETTRASLSQENYARLKETVQRRGKGAPWLVLTHDNPDPDALASALILGRVIRTAFKHNVTLAYGGIVGRAENREMLHALRLPFVHVRGLSLKSYRGFALVDTQPKSGNNQLPPRLLPDVVIDHHPVRQNTQNGPFFDIRPEYGATATILAEYMLAAGIQPTHAEATALIYAIRSETQDFAREFTGRDKAIYDLFFPRADHRLLARIQSPRLPLTYFANLHDALENLESVGTLVVSHLGAVEQPDIVPEIADLLLRLEGKTWALCTGFYQDRLYLSIRTTNPRAEAGSLMHRLLERRGKGGGHGRTAGGWIDLSKTPDEEARRKLQRSIAARLARELDKNPEKLTRIELRAARPGPVEERPPQPSVPAPTGSRSRTS
ncbi:MAG TPA: DHH family phosphoesterase [Thermoanaerobaculia bacterium]|nr:DHH family phosphoesterase [Thermoanaerobaculia bacterium]